MSDWWLSNMPQRPVAPWFPPQDEALAASMTHQAEQSNAAAPYLQAARDFGRGGITELLRGLGYQLPNWSNQISAVAQSEPFNTAIGMTVPLKAAGAIAKAAEEAASPSFQAYHGSPHDFERFDPAFLGKGAGTTFGYGHSFAENPEYAAAFKQLPPREGITAKPTSYQVAINADPASLLDFEKSFKEQSPQVQEVLKQLKKETGADFRGNAAGFDIYDSIRAALGGDKAAARKLSEAGIPGLRYEEKRGEPNYTIFNESLINIIKKYGLAGLLAPGAAQFLPAPGSLQQ